MNTERILKIGLLGCGNNGNTHARAAAQSKLVEITACADLIRDSVRNMRVTSALRKSAQSGKEEPVV